MSELENWMDAVEAVLEAPNGVAAAGRLVSYILGVGAAEQSDSRNY